MCHDLETGKRISELFEKKIESQTTLSVGFFGASVLLFVSSANSNHGNPLDVTHEYFLWISYGFFGLTILSGYFARLSLMACIPVLLNYEWKTGSAALATYDGKSTLENLMLAQFLLFLMALIFTALFLAMNFRTFVI